MAFQVPRKYTDEEYEQELEEKSKAGASLKRLRSGRWDDIESLADEMLRRSLVGVTKYKDKADILTAWKFQMRQQREVLTASGFPDASIRKGIYRRCANPTRPELNCLSGDTEVLIRDRGMIPIRDLEGTTQQVLTSEGWGKGEFYSFGVQPLMKISLYQHNRRHEKTIFATDNHRWFIYGPHQIEECLTSDLTPSEILVCVLPPSVTNPKSYQWGWGVDSVEAVGEELVYCAVVPSTEDFVIEGYILSGNSRDGVARARTRFNNTQESHESRADI